MLLKPWLEFVPGQQGTKGVRMGTWKRRLGGDHLAENEGPVARE